MPFCWIFFWFVIALQRDEPTNECDREKELERLKYGGKKKTSTDFSVALEKTTRTTLIENNFSEFLMGKKATVSNGQ